MASTRISPNVVTSRFTAAGSIVAFAFTAVTSIWLAAWWPKIGLIASLVLLIVLAWPDLRHRARLNGCKQTRTKSTKGWVFVLLATAGLATLLAIACWLTGAWQGTKVLGVFDKSTHHWVSVKLPTVLVQQVVLQMLLVPVLCQVFGRTGPVVFCSAVIFAGVHCPNPLLMAITFLAGCFWVATYLKYQQLAPLVVSHFVLAVLAAGLGGEYVLNMRVGPSCLELLPRSRQLADREIVVFPRTITGCVERLSQDGNQLILEGWAVDSIHDQRPAELFLDVGHRLVPFSEIQWDSKRQLVWQNARDSGFVGAEFHCFRASVPVDPEVAEIDCNVMATNANGWYSRIGKMGEIKPHRLAATNRRTQIFPTGIDGRINNVVQRNDGVWLMGWAVDLTTKAVPRTLVIQSADQTHRISLAEYRVQRDDIATAFNESAFQHCGFQVKVATSRWSPRSTDEFYILDQAGTLHYLEKTSLALASLDAFQSRANKVILK